jgi:CubicO group peptidase (beta-lactamase class C family)
MYAAMIGEVDGIRLLTPATVEKARTLRTGAMVPADDLGKLQLGPPLRYGLGYQLAGDANSALGPGSFGHDGAGGRMAFAHPESGIAAAYVANTMVTVLGVPDPRWVWMEELRKAVGA